MSDITIKQNSENSAIQAVVNSVRNFYSAVVNRMIRLREYNDRRRAFERLRSLDDHLLDDIGLNRDDVEWGLELPLWQDAAEQSRRRVKTRRARNARPFRRN